MAMCSGEFKTVYAMLTNAFNLSATEVSTLTTRRLVVAISGASGVIYGVRTLQLLRELRIETHLVMTRAAKITLSHETDLKVADVEALASVVHPAEDVGASISSGSFRTLGMIVAPCSIRSLSEIASGVTTGLLSRAADVALKERRRLVLLVREAPLHAGHLKSMLAATEMGAIIMPPVPAFYFRPNSLDAVIDQTIGRSLDLFDLEAPGTQRWEGSR
jgi:flavin prenyltransferase